MKTTLIILLSAALVSSCTTIKTTPGFSIGEAQFEGFQTKERHGKAIKWRSQSHPQWAKVEKP